MSKWIVNLKEQTASSEDIKFKLTKSISGEYQAEVADKTEGEKLRKKSVDGQAQILERAKEAYKKGLVAKNVNEVLRGLMQELIYPAVLGTGMVFLLMRSTMESKSKDCFLDPAFWFGLIVILFFIGCFVSMFLVEEDKYSKKLFAFDLMEAILIFFILHFLKLTKTIWECPDLFEFYICFAAVIFIQYVWLKSGGVVRESSFALIITTLITLAEGAYFLKLAPEIKWAWVYIAGLLTVCLSIYWVELKDQIISTEPRTDKLFETKRSQVQTIYNTGLDISKTIYREGLDKVKEIFPNW